MTVSPSASASALDLFLRNYESLTLEQETWGALQLVVRAYRCDELPPDDWITSVRCLVRYGDQVVVLRNEEGGIHVLPGGRREADESLLTTLHREIREETGWTILEPRLLGFIWFQHQTPKPEGYRYPYPDFLQVVYVAEIDDGQPQQPVVDDYENHAALYPIAEADQLPLSARDRLYLSAACNAT